MPIFYTCIKSHCEVPDFEFETEAESKARAVEILVKKGWDRDLIEKCTYKLEDPQR